MAVKKNKMMKVEGGTRTPIPKIVKIGVPILIVVLLIGVPILISSIIGTGMTGGGATTQVEVVEVVAEDITEEITVTGTVSSDRTKTFFSPVNGTVSHCKVKVGQVVKEGDLLIGYDQEELAYANQQSEFTYMQSLSEYNVAVANDSKLKSEVSEAKGKVTSTNNSINATEATMKKLENSISSLSAQQETKQAEIEKLEKQIAELEKENAGNAPSGDGNSGTDEEVNTEKEDTTTDNTNVTLEELKMELTRAEQELSAITTQIATQTTSLESNAQALSKLEAELAQNEAIVDSGSAGMTGEQLNVLAMSNNLAELADLEADELLELGKKGIVAEFDGVVASVNAVEGMQTAQGMELITVASNREVSVDVEIPANEFDSVDVGNLVEITMNKQEYRGEVSEISQIAIMNTSGTSVIPARIEILNSDDNMFLGVNAKNTIITESKENVLCVPSSTINTSKDGEFVYVLENGIVEKRIVELGVTALDKIEVISGLKEGDLVISDMVAVLTEGMKAEPKTTVGNVAEDGNNQVKPNVSVSVKGQ